MMYWKSGWLSTVGRREIGLIIGTFYLQGEGRLRFLILGRGEISQFNFREGGLDPHAEPDSCYAMTEGGQGGAEFSALQPPNPQSLNAHPLNLNPGHTPELSTPT